MNVINKKTVLIIDDMELNREILTLILQDKYNTIEANNGLNAIKTLEKNEKSISLILLDIVMPIMDGFKFLQHIQDDDRFNSIPIIFITSETHKENILKGVKMGVRDVIAKPFDPYLVCNRVHNLITLSERRESLRQVNQNENKQLTVLLADNVESNRLIIKEAIGNQYNILEAENGEEAITLLENNKNNIDVIIFNIIMPIMNGIKMMEEVNRRKLIRQIPVIAIATEDSLPKINKIKDLGICEVIHKPFNVSIVRNRVNYLIELYQSKTFYNV